jgi:NADPH:quinone reductase-like Zn-dependent oxidoreductase
LRNFAIFGDSARETHSRNAAISTVMLNDVAVHCGVIDTPVPVFDRDDPVNTDRVLFRVKAFSLNYRDKNRIFTMCVRGQSDGFYVVGSEFLGEVLEIGPGVTELAPGDRVMGNNAYPVSGSDAAAPGVPTNHASKEVQVLHKAKLMKVPDAMTDATAASFTIGAQTTYSMIRRLELFDGANILVTSAKSNTSLFAIAALKDRNVNVYASSTSTRFEDELRARGVKDLFVIGPECGNFIDHPPIRDLVKRTGGFHFVIDPYYDLHLSRVLDVMAVGGRYITCGLYDQYLGLIKKDGAPVYRTSRELYTMMLKNLQVFGNCIGLTSDLEKASQDFAAGKLDVVIDSVYSNGLAAEFLDRTFNSKDRFGKVIYQYD